MINIIHLKQIIKKEWIKLNHKMNHIPKNNMNLIPKKNPKNLIYLWSNPPLNPKLNHHISHQLNKNRIFPFNPFSPLSPEIPYLRLLIHQISLLKEILLKIKSQCNPLYNNQRDHLFNHMGLKLFLLDKKILLQILDQNFLHIL